jgi:hypothetical protein
VVPGRYKAAGDRYLKHKAAGERGWPDIRQWLASDISRLVAAIFETCTKNYRLQIKIQPT